MRRVGIVVLSVRDIGSPTPGQNEKYVAAYFLVEALELQLDDRLRAEGFLPEAFTLGCSKPVSTSSTPPGQVFVRRKLSDRELVEPVEGEMRGGPI
jgi:hypothetical protein